MLLQNNNLVASLRLFSLGALILTGIASIIGSNEGPTPGISTPDSNYVAFLADKDTDGTNELYAYSLGTGNINKINSTLVSGGNVTSYSVSPNGEYIAYVADQDIVGQYQLFVANPDGSAVTEVSATSDNVGDDILWAPNSSRIAYRNEETARGANVYALHTVRPDGSGNVIVNPVEVPGGSVAAASFSWAPNSSRIAYLADQSTLDVVELYTSPTNGAAGNAKVNADLITGREVTEYAWSPDSSTIAYRADQNETGAFELFTATAIGGNNIKISADHVGNNKDIKPLSLVWAPDGSRIAYIADESTEGEFNLYTVMPSGTNRLQVSDNALHLNGNVIGIPAWSPDSQHIAYKGDLEADEQFELFVSTPTVANSGDKINSTLLGGNVLTGPDDVFSPPAWSPNSDGIAYVAQQDSVVWEVYVGRVNGTNVKVSAATTVATKVDLGSAGEVWSPNGDRLLYKADQLVSGRPDLFTTLPTGNSSIARITRNPAQADGLKSFGKWSPDSAYVAYVSAQDSATADELYISTNTGGNNRKISGTLVSDGNVDSVYFSWAP